MTDGLEALTILVVDDNPQMRAIIGAVLGGAGVRNIYYADNGEKALELIDTLPIDIVYLDHEMPRMNGLETLRALRSRRGDERFTPVIMVTGHSDIVRITAARDHGVNEFLGKPVTARNLLNRLEAVILHPRPFLESSGFFGPDRRRRASPDAPKRRRGDRKAAS